MTDHPPTGAPARPGAPAAGSGSALATATRRLLTVRSLDPSALAWFVLASVGGAAIATVASWPLWGVAVAALLPWSVVLGAEVAWIGRHHRMLALFYLLVVTQGGHLLEHLVQMVQVHVLGLSGPDASGVFTALDAEWVHFGWNTWVLVVTIPLLLRFRDNRWLWLAAAAAVWHEVEHVYLIVGHIRSGLEADPGLLADGGALAGGVPVPRVDLHFVYNVVETLPLFIAFGVALRSSADTPACAARRPAARD